MLGIRINAHPYAAYNTPHPRQLFPHLQQGEKQLQLILRNGKLRLFPAAV